MNMLQALRIASAEISRRLIKLEIQGDLDNQKATFTRIDELREAAHKIESLISVCRDED